MKKERWDCTNKSCVGYCDTCVNSLEAIREEKNKIFFAIVETPDRYGCEINERQTMLRELCIATDLSYERVMEEIKSLTSPRMDVGISQTLEDMRYFNLIKKPDKKHGNYRDIEFKNKKKRFSQ